MDDDVRQQLQELRAENQNLREAVAKQQHLMESDRALDRSRNNHDFVQMYRTEMQELRRLSIENPAAMQVLLVMAEKMNRQNALVISQKALMKITKRSRATLTRAVRKLKEERFVQIVKIGTANAYIINSAVFWSARADIKDKLATFSATVVAIGSEQEYEEDWEGVELKRLPFLEPPDEQASVVDDGGPGQTEAEV